MGVYLYILLAIGLFMLVIYLLKPRAIFSVSVRDGHIQKVRGKAKPNLVRDIAEVVKSAEVSKAKIWAVPDGSGKRLKVSGDIDEGTAQRLRNVFGMYRF